VVVSVFVSHSVFTKDQSSEKTRLRFSGISRRSIIFLALLGSYAMDTFSTNFDKDLLVFGSDMLQIFSSTA